MVIVNDTNLDSASEAGVFDVLSGGVAHGFTIGGVIRHVTTGDKGDISEAAGIGEGHGDTLIIGLFQGGHGDSGAEGGNGNTVHTLGYVGVDEFGFLGLVIAGVADDDLFDTEFLAGIFETLYHGFHELVILEDDTRDDDVFDIHRFDNYGAASGTGGGNIKFFQPIGFTPGVDGGFISSGEGDARGDGKFSNAVAGFTGQVINQVGHSGDALPVGILSDGGLHLTVDDHGADLIGTVEPEDSDLLSGLFDSHSSTDGTAFIAGKDDLNVGVGGDHVRSSGECGVLLFSGLMSNDLVVDAGSFQTFFKTAVAEF